MLMILLFIQLEKIVTPIKILQITFFYLQKCFYDNYIILNADKCGYMNFGSNPDKSDLILKGSTKIPSAEEFVVF